MFPQAALLKLRFVGDESCCSGIYGLLTQTVLTRSQDIGIRMALGASRVGVLGSVIRDAFVLTIMGIALGVGGSVFGVRILTGMLYEVRSENATIFALSSAALLVTALIAAWIPAYRAASVDPMKALRSE